MSLARLWLAFAGVVASAFLSAGAARPQSFDAKGVKIRYAVEGKGPPVVLIHGLYASGFLNWKLTGVVPDLAKDHQVITLDLPGHGQSARPDNKEAYGAQMAEDVILLLDRLKIKKAHVVGYSLGGMVAMKIMAKYPDRILSGTVGGMGWFREGSGLQKIFRKMKGGGLGPPSAFFDAVETLGLSEQELKQIKTPVRVLVGDRDVCKQLYVEPLQKVRKDWPVVEIKDADHISCLFRPQFREEIASWLRKDAK
jgi:pimeloyl-ACP methyl ester carboxylesterase